MADPEPKRPPVAARFRPRSWHVATLAALALGVHVYLTGVWVVNETEQGVVLRFGRADRVLPAGMHFTLPWPVESVRRVATTEVRTMPVGFKLRESMRGIPPAEDEVQWLTGDTNIVDLRVVVQYVVRDPVDYLFRVGAMPDGERRDHLLRKVAESALTRLVARTPIDVVLSVGKAKLQSDARAAIQETVDRLGLGVSLLNVNIVEANPPAVVIPSFKDVSSAKADKERSMNEADGYRRKLLLDEGARANDILQEARIYKAETVDRSKGASRRFSSLAEKVRLSPEVSRKRIWLDAIGEALARTQTVVYPSVPGKTFLFTTVE